jgi:hypothetical protein
MSLKSFAGFRSLETHHCVTGSMLHIYDFHRHPISEDMLLGLGAGLGFIYWHMKGMPPMFGGRGNVGRPGEEGLEVTAGRRTGVRVEKHYTGSAKKAEKVLLEMLEAGQPVMMNVDMGFLPYFTDLPDDFHFGGHVIAIGGYDAETRRALVADRDKPLHPVSLDDIAKARGSTFKPFPPRHMWFTFDFSRKRQPHPEEIRQAIREVSTTMLEGPISNIGVRGIRKAAKRTLKWPDTMNEEELRWACFNNFIFIDATGGTGGGIFRYMYGRFLEEGARITGDERLADVGSDMRSIGDLWQEVAMIFKRGSEIDNPVDVLAETTAPLMELADLEEVAWTRLRDLV